jgi:hypothetical protein
MKNLFYTVCLFILTHITFSNTNYGQNDTANQDFFNKLTFEIELNKKEYVQFEPIFVKAEIVNKTQKPLAIMSLPSFSRIQLLVRYNGGERSKTFGNLFLIGTGRDGFGTTLDNNQSITGNIVLEKNLNDMFPNYGKYNIQVILKNSFGKEIKSEIKEITISEPTGIDKEAVVFLKKAQNSALFWWKEDADAEHYNKTGKSLMEDFTERYSSSVFGDYSIFRLANDYLNAGHIEKAAVEFEKIKLSSNKKIADDANKAIEDIEKSKNYLLKQPRQK